MRIALLLLLGLLAAAPAWAQQDYFSKRNVVFAGKPALATRVTLLKAKDDYLIVSDSSGQQMVVWVTRYATLRKKHHGALAKTRKAYLDELVPGTAAKLEAVHDEQGRLLLKRLTVYDTIDEFESE